MIRVRFWLIEGWIRIRIKPDMGLDNTKPDPVNLKSDPQPWIWQLKFQVRNLLFGLEINPLEILQEKMRFFCQFSH